MKLVVGLSLSLLVLSCAPGDPANSHAPTGNQSVADYTSAENRFEDATPLAKLESVGAEAQITTHQTLYVPVYSHVYFGHDKRHFNLACTLSIRNIDTLRPITLTAVDYYNTTGEFVRPFVDEPRTLAPLETVDFYIQERDISGGSGANFIVRWSSPTEVNAPIVEAVMIGVAEGQGISFVCPSRKIAE